MAYCNQCGNDLPEGALFCPGCGASVAAADAPPERSQPDTQLQGDTETGATPPPAVGQIPKDVRNMAMLCHLVSFAGLTGIPLTNILGPLFIWLMKREDSPFIDTHSKESLNFQISMTIYLVISAILIVIVIVIGILLLVIFFVFDIVVVIVAAIRANGGQEYRYPLTMRFVK